MTLFGWNFLRNDQFVYSEESPIISNDVPLKEEIEFDDIDNDLSI